MECYMGRTGTGPPSDPCPKECQVYVGSLMDAPNEGAQDRFGAPTQAREDREEQARAGLLPS